MKKENLDSKFEIIFNKISSETFLTMKALSGELPFYLVTYNIEQTKEVEKHIRLLFNRLKNNNLNITVIDIYDVIIKILEDKQLLNAFVEEEPKLKKSNFYTIIKNNVIENNRIGMAISEIVKNNNFNLILIKGFEKIYPLPAYSIISNLQTIIKNIPVVIFYPGSFNGRQIFLFNKFKEPFYRAFNLESINI